MVGTRLPKGIIALHPLKADQDILHGIVQRMAHMELPRDIRRGNHYGKRSLPVIYLRMKIFLFHPFFIQFVLYALGVIGFRQFFTHESSPLCFFISFSGNRLLMQAWQAALCE